MIDFEDLPGAPNTRSDDRWPEPEQFLRFPLNQAHPFNFRELPRYYEGVMRQAFRGRRVEVLDHELKQLTFYPAAGVDPVTGMKLRTPKTSPRVFLKLGVDAWIKEPDPMVTCWERIKLWLARKPIPKAAEPDRLTVYYSMSPLQVDIFRRLWAEEFAHELPEEKT